MIRRALIFLLLFGGGLAALVELFDVQLPTKWGAPKATLPEHAKSGATLTGDEFGSVVLLVNGATEYNRYVQVGDRGVPRYRLVAQDSETAADGSVVLRDLVLELFDADDGEQSVELRAAVGRTRLESATDSVQPSLSNQITFEDVSVELLRGTRLVPLVMTSERLEGDLETRIFSTPTRAVIEGSGLDAEGSALDLDLGAGRVVFASDARCTVVAGGRGRGRLVSAGPLQIERLDGEGESRLKVVAERRALLAVEGEGGLSIEARRIEIVGQAAEGDEANGAGSTAGDEGPADALVFETLVAQGEATLRTDGHRFDGQRLQFNMTPDGALGTARLIGGPEAHLAIDPPGAETAGAPPELLRVWGESTMDLVWSPEVKVTVAGPAQMDWRETELWAAGGLSGSPATDDQPARFRAWVGVEVRFANWTLETPELDGRIDADELRVTTIGESDVRGLTRDGEELHLIAYDALTFVAVDDEWSVPQAGRVALTLDSEPPVSASADRLVEFDPETLSFVAEGNVEVTTRGDFLRGGRVVARGRDDMTIESGGGERVFYVSPRAEVLAHSLRRTPGRALAEGDVEATLTLDELRGNVRADRVEVLAALEDGQSLESSRRTELSAVGDVVATLREGDETYDLSGDDLWLRREPLPEGDSALTELRVIGSVDVTMVGTYGHYRLRSKRLEGLLFNRGPEALPANFDDDTQGELVAEGEVELESLGERALVAEGHRLVLRQDGSGTLEPAPDGTVSAVGDLPSAGRPFSLVAQWLRFAPDLLVARRPEIRLDPVPGAVDVGPLDGLRANAVDLVARPGLLSFDGDVSFVGSTPSGSSWSLRAQHARFVGDAKAPADQQRLAKMAAEDDVRISFSDGPTAEGDSLDVRTWSGVISLIGRPARVQHGTGLAIASEFIRLDPRDYTVKTGRVIFGIPVGSGSPQDLPK